MDTAYLIRVAAAKFPHRVALRYRDQALTFHELDIWIDRLAAGLIDAGVHRDGPVASVLLNDPRTVCLYLALARAGITGVPINYRLTAEEIAFILNDAGAGSLVIDAELLAQRPDLPTLASRLGRMIVVAPEGSFASAFADFLADASVGELDCSIAESDDATIIYTSGTSGFPKGAVRSHRANLWNAVNSLIGAPRTTDDVELFSLPLFGIGFVAQVLPTLLAGGCIVLDRVFEPRRAWALMAGEGVTRAFLAPTMIAALLDVPDHDKYDVSALQTILVAYEFPERLRERAIARFGEVFLNLYGLTEAQLCCTAPGEFALDPTSAGHPMGLARTLILREDGTAAAPGEPGEIAFEGPSVMTRYQGRPDDSDAVLRNGVLRTGDLGYLDDQRRLHFSGRSKEIIKSGGFSIDPVEIENALLEFECVREAAVIGVPDEYWGEMVIGYLVADPSPTETELREHCRVRLASFKVPKQFVLVEGLPKNPTGKVERGSLRRRWHDDSSSPQSQA